MESDVNVVFRLARVKPHSTLVAVRTTIRRADRRHLTTTSVTTATYRSPQLIQVTSESRRTPEPVARICHTSSPHSHVTVIVRAAAAEHCFAVNRNSFVACHNHSANLPNFNSQHRFILLIILGHT